jgi:hypothetical protein
MIKLAIVAVILVVGAILFSTELHRILPQTSSNLADSLHTDLSKAKEATFQTVEGRIDDTINNVERGVGDTIQSVRSNLENFKDDSVSTISDGIDKISSLRKTNDKESDKIEPLETHSSNPKIKSSNLQSFQPSVTTTENPKTQTITFDTLSLTTAKQTDDLIKLHYEDTSGKTISVKVTLRTTEKELFSGIFYSSMFETFVADSLNTPYFIDMEVDHELHGTIASSVFNLGDSPDVLINGVFTKS